MPKQLSEERHKEVLEEIQQKKKEMEETSDPLLKMKRFEEIEALYEKYFD